MVSDGCAVYYIKLILDHFDSTIFLYWLSKGIPNSQYHNGTSIQYHLTTIGDHVSTNGDHLTTISGSQMVSIGTDMVSYCSQMVLHGSTIMVLTIWYPLTVPV